jgi:hypothetical protein
LARLFGELDPWLKELWERLLALYPLPVGSTILPEGQLYAIHHPSHVSCSMRQN